MKKLFSLLLAAALLAACAAPALAAGAEGYGEAGWAERGAYILRADGTRQALPRSAGRLSETAQGASMGHAALPDGSGGQFIVRMAGEGRDTLTPFYAFNAPAPGGQAWVRIGTLPGSRCCVVIRSEDTKRDVVYAPGLGVGDKLVFDTQSGVRYSVRLAWGDAAGLGSVAVAGEPALPIGDGPYDGGMDWTAVDTRVCTPERDYHAYGQAAAPAGAGAETVLLTAWTDSIPQDLGPGSVSRLFLCDWQTGGAGGVIRADFSQSSDPDRAPISLLVYNAAAGRISDYVTLEEGETASFLLAPNGDYRFYLTHQGGAAEPRSARLILTAAPAGLAAEDGPQGDGGGEHFKRTSRSGHRPLRDVLYTGRA